MELAQSFIPRKTIYESISSHPWINQTCLELISEKKAAWNTPDFHKKAEVCSRGLFREYLSYVQRTKTELAKLRRGSKQWWSLSKRLMNKAGSSTDIPALKRSDSSWARSPEEKADLFADTFSSKWILPNLVINGYTEDVTDNLLGDYFIPIRSGKAKFFLASLDSSSGTGPDLLPTRLLKELAAQLAVPFAKLTRSIIKYGRWPFL